MRKYSKELISDYVNGMDIDADIDTLESDKDFMMQVIDFSNDKNMYNMCSDSIRCDYEFVMFLLGKFKDDELFIQEVADYYLAHHKVSEGDISNFELNIIMAQLLVDGSYKARYNINSLVFYIENIMAISSIQENDKDEVIRNSGKGFILVENSFENSGIIKEYFARNFLNEIFPDTYLAFERMIHSKVKSYEMIEKEGINTFLLSIVSSVDPALSYYVSVHIDLLDVYKELLSKVECNWDTYLSNLNERRSKVFYKELEDYMEDMDDVRFNRYDIENYLRRDKEFAPLLYDSDPELYSTSEEMIKLMDDEKRLTFRELKCLRDMVALARELTSKDVIEDTKDDDYIEKKPTETELIQFGFGK